MKGSRGEAKPIPVTRAAWQREVTGITSFIAKMDRYAPDYGPDWVRKMTQYYRERLAALKAHPPKPARLKGRGRSDHPLREDNG